MVLNLAAAVGAPIEYLTILLRDLRRATEQRC
jgi:hypothetical protein